MMTFFERPQLLRPSTSFIGLIGFVYVWTYSLPILVFNECNFTQQTKLFAAYHWDHIKNWGFHKSIRNSWKLLIDAISLLNLLCSTGKKFKSFLYKFCFVPALFFTAHTTSSQHLSVSKNLPTCLCAFWNYYLFFNKNSLCFYWKYLKYNRIGWSYLISH